MALLKMWKSALFNSLVTSAVKCEKAAGISSQSEKSIGLGPVNRAI